MKYYIIFLSIFFIHCQSGSTNPESFQNCDPPEAIFSKEMDQVEKHSFEKNDLRTLETIVLKSGMELELKQSGCKKIEQQFQFKIKQNIYDKTAEELSLKIADSFMSVSALDKTLFQMESWGQVFKQLAPEIKIGERTHVMDNIYIKINKMKGGDGETILFANLYNEQ